MLALRCLNIFAGSARAAVRISELQRIRRQDASLSQSNELPDSLSCAWASRRQEKQSAVTSNLLAGVKELILPRWQGDEEFQELVVAVLRHLPLRTASQISARALRQVLQATDGVTSRVFRLFNDLAADAIESGAECITDESIAAWRPMTRPTPAFA